MKALCLTFLFLISAACSHATPSSQIIASCLKTETVAEGIRYVDIIPGSFNVEEDETRNTISTTITFHNREVGIWKTTDSDNFGVVYRNRKIPASRAIRLRNQAPSPFNPYTAQWGEAGDAKTTYICITFNFEGLGESGSFQNIRGLYLIESNSARPKIYYTVGDIRR